MKSKQELFGTNTVVATALIIKGIFPNSLDRVGLLCVTFLCL